MELTVKYIGNDDKYWSKLKQKFASDYKNFNLHFLTKHIDENFNPRECFVKTYHEKPNIVYVDFSVQEKACLNFCKIFNRNNSTRLASLVALHDYSRRWNDVHKSLLAGVRINHFKSGEVYDVVYDPINLLNVELAKDPEYVYGKDLGIFHLKQILRVSFVEDDCFHVETTSKLPIEKVIAVNNNPLSQLSSSLRFYVKNYSDTNLYYHSRFSYDLEFSYIDDSFFQATEKSWLLYKKFKDNPLGYKEETGQSYEELIGDVKKRKENIRPLREGIRKWIRKNADIMRPKKVKIMVIDDTMDIFSELDESKKRFPYSLNIQNQFTDNYYQIKRTKPDFIAVHYDAVNNMEKLNKLIENIALFSHYTPYILVFNYNAEGKIKEFLDYEHLLSFKGSVHLNTIEQMAQKLDEKLHLSETKDRVYFKTSSPESIITFTREVKVLTMTESIIYFKSEIEIPMWTTFIMEEPTKMLVTIIPHRSSGKYKNESKCYRAMINGLGEKEKKILRRTVNKSLETED